jgi:carboxyl-terminal processing protease
LEDLKKQGMKGLILDVRYNAGGIFSSCVEIVDEILPKGTIVYVEDKYGKREYEFSDEEHKLDMPLVVLINESSASASEILAGAIRDHEYGTLIGTKTYGKGIVQKTFGLKDGSAVKFTVEKYFTPNGENIQDVGIEPDIELEYNFLGTEDQEYDYDLDNQIQKGIEVLTKELL